MSKATVYLAGPVTGCSYEGCTDWREYAIKKLKQAGIVGVSPLRGTDYLKNQAVILDSYDGTAISSSRGIITRDRWDATRCDVLLANMLGAEKVSIGTVMEIAWADLARIPIILVIEPSKVEAVGREASVGNVHEHSMIREVAGFRVETLEEGLHVAKSILRAYV